MEFIFSLITSFVKLIDGLAGGNQWLVTVIIGALMIALRKTPAKLYQYIKYKMTVTVTVNDNSVNEKSETIDEFLVYIKDKSFNAFQRSYLINDRGRSLDDKILSGGGVNFMSVDGVLIKSHLVLDKTEKGILRRLTLTVAIWNKHKLRNILRGLYTQDHDLTPVLKYNIGHEVLNVVHHTKEFYKHQQQLIDPKIYDMVDSIVNRFKNDPEYYEVYEKPHKECFMFYGPPGTGKTTLFRHMSAKYALPLVYSWDIDSLEKVIGLLKRDKLGKVIVVIEDIAGLAGKSTYHRQGGFFPQPMYVNQNRSTEEDEIEESKKAEQQRVVSKFINILDGLVPLENVIVVLTTNKIDSIPSSVFRAGRVDHLVHLDYPGEETIIKALRMAENDPRLEEIRKTDVSRLPLASVIRLRHSNSIDEVKQVLADVDKYHKLADQTTVY